MALLPLDQLTAGMEVGEDVHNLSGVLLLGAGAVLTNKTIGLFRHWGVEFVHVATPQAEDAPSAQASDLPPEVLQKVEQEMAVRFRHVQQNQPPVPAILALAKPRWQAALLSARPDSP